MLPFAKMECSRLLNVKMAIAQFFLQNTQVTQNFYNNGFDVVISRIDTTEALVVADQKRKEGKDVWAVSYDYRNACEGAPEACLGVPALGV